MTESKPTRKTIHLPEITRIEGHAAVHIDIENGAVCNVEMQVFEGVRFFEKLVVGHQFYEIPHITSRVCAICSTGHVLAAAFAQEAIIGFQQPPRLRNFRELMHLGMIIESHATHVFALALPDFVGAKDLVDFATKHKKEFTAWKKLRSLGGLIQTVLGGRPFHPVNLQVGGFSRYPSAGELQPLAAELRACKQFALDIVDFLLKVKPPVKRATTPVFVALIPDTDHYGFFGDTVRSTADWEAPVSEYQTYLQETSVDYSRAKRTTARGENMMVGSLARLVLYGDRLRGDAKTLFASSPIAAGDTNSIFNNLGQAIEIVEAMDRSLEIIAELSALPDSQEPRPVNITNHGGRGVGAIECPRGTLYHAYDIDATGTILSADMITPSVQNSGRIELDIREVVAAQPGDQALEAGLETLVRAYDPCNTCATHMVKIQYK